MSSKTVLKIFPSRFHLSFNIKNIDAVFPGFSPRNFAVLHGSSTVLSLSMLLCVRAQLPYQLGGLETNIVFVDGGNTFRLYEVSHISQLHELDPRKVLERIFISRAFTAYQMTALIFEKLKPAIEKCNSKLVIISDIASLYFDKDVPNKESRAVFNQLTNYLLKFAEENHIIVVATFLPHYSSRLHTFLKAVVCARASVVASVKTSKNSQCFILEKHPSFNLGSAYFPFENLTLTKFLKA